MNPEYVRGFIERCVARGYDPEKLIKNAQAHDPNIFSGAWNWFKGLIGAPGISEAIHKGGIPGLVGTNVWDAAASEKARAQGAAEAEAATSGLTAPIRRGVGFLAGGDPYVERVNRDVAAAKQRYAEAVTGKPVTNTATAGGDDAAWEKQYPYRARMLKELEERKKQQAEGGGGTTNITYQLPYRPLWAAPIVPRLEPRFRQESHVPQTVPTETVRKLPARREQPPQVADRGQVIDVESTDGGRVY